MIKLYEIIGVTQPPVSHVEKIVSAIGGFISILCIFIVSQEAVGSDSAGIIVASMGASAVLLFAVPHGQLSQPWSVFGGHIVSALVGVTCAQIVENEVFSASLAVGIAIGVMYYLRCVHPPGGATALSAVIGGEAVRELGYLYVITPILLNVFIILLIGVLFNYLFHWRRYPTFLHRQNLPQSQAPSNESASHISHEDFVYALSEIDSFIDINERDLLRIYDLAIKKAQDHSLAAERIDIGGFYSNGEYGENWSVRQIVDESPGTDPDKDIVVYKVVAGFGRRSADYSLRSAFLRWAKHRVMPDEGNWKRISDIDY